jgi:hypothetical protein
MISKHAGLFEFALSNRGREGVLAEYGGETYIRPTVSVSIALREQGLLQPMLIRKYF